MPTLKTSVVDCCGFDALGCADAGSVVPTLRPHLHNHALTGLERDDKLPHQKWTNPMILIHNRTLRSTQTRAD